MMDTIYVGSGKGVIFKGDSYPKKINFSVCLSDLPEEHIFEYEGKDGKKKKYIKLTVSEKKSTDKFGKTHSVSVNTWKPSKPLTTNEVEKTLDVKDDEQIVDTESLPF